MNFACGIVLIIAGLTAADPGFPGRYGQWGNGGNGFNFVPNEFGVPLPQKLQLNRLNNVFGNSPVDFQRAMPRFTRQLGRNSPIGQAVPMLASNVLPSPAGQLLGASSFPGLGDNQFLQNGVRSLVSGANPPFGHSDFLQPGTSVFSAATAGMIPSFLGSQNSHKSGSSASPALPLSNVFTQATSGFLGQNPTSSLPSASGFSAPSLSTVLPQAFSPLTGSQGSNLLKPLGIVDQITSPFGSVLNSGSTPTSGSVASDSSDASSLKSSSNVSQRTERSSPAASPSLLDQVTTTATKPVLPAVLSTITSAAASGAETVQSSLDQSLASTPSVLAAVIPTAGKSNGAESASTSGSSSDSGSGSGSGSSSGSESGSGSGSGSGSSTGSSSGSGSGSGTGSSSGSGSSSSGSGSGSGSSSSSTASASSAQGSAATASSSTQG